MLHKQKCNSYRRKVNNARGIKEIMRDIKRDVRDVKWEIKRDIDVYVACTTTLCTEAFTATFAAKQSAVPIYTITVMTMSTNFGLPCCLAFLSSVS